MEEITKRDFFAAMAMQALIKIGSQSIREVKCEGDHGHTKVVMDFPSQPYYFGEWEPVEKRFGGVDVLATDAYLVADAMLVSKKESAYADIKEDNDRCIPRRGTFSKA